MANSRIGRLFPDYKQQEIGYYQKTGLVPIMHTVVIKDSVLDFGPDPWAYAYLGNAAMLETMIRFSHEQGMISRRMPSEELFVPSTLGELPSYH